MWGNDRSKTSHGDELPLIGVRVITNVGWTDKPTKSAALTEGECKYSWSHRPLHINRLVFCAFRLGQAVRGVVGYWCLGRAFWQYSWYWNKASLEKSADDQALA